MPHWTLLSPALVRMRNPGQKLDADGSDGRHREPEVTMATQTPRAASLLPQHVAFDDRELSLLDDLYEMAEIDAICDALFADVGAGEALPRS
jgi:hypothetical protein